MSDALLINSSLKDLYLSDCQIDDQGAAILANMLIGNHKLLTLHIPENHIGDKGALHFGRALACGATIFSLGLSKNNISLQGTENLAFQLFCNRSLRKLILFGNEVSGRTQLKIDHYLRSNVLFPSEKKQGNAVLSFLENFSVFKPRNQPRGTTRGIRGINEDVEDDQHGHNLRKFPWTSPSRPGNF